MAHRPPVDAVVPAGLEPAPSPCAALRHRGDYQLTRLLLSLQATGASAMVRVRAEATSSRLHIRDGALVFVSGGLPSDSLGRVLVRRGVLSQEQLAQVVEQRMAIQGRKRFGEVAVDLGLIDPPRLREALHEQVLDKLARCLCWESVELESSGADHAARPAPGEPLALERLVLKAVRKHFSAKRVAAILEFSRLGPLRLRGDPQRIVERFGLCGAPMRDLDGVTARPLASLPEPARRLACALALCDQLSVARSGPAALSLVPPPPETAGDGDAPPLLSRDKLLADSAFLQGRELLRTGEYAAAVDALKTAADLRPGAREYALVATWAAYLANRRSARWRQRVQDGCDDALRQDRSLAFAHYVEGELALHAGCTAEARSKLSRAVQLDPSLVEARRSLESLAE